MQKCIWAQHICYVNPHVEAVKWSHFFRNSCLGKESNSPSSDPLEISSLQWLSISILHLFSLEGNSNVSKALSPPFCKSTFFSTLCMYMQGWTRGIFRSCFAAKPNFSTWRRETLHDREKWTFLILLPWASDMLEDHSPTPTNCSCFFPLVVAQGGEHCPLQCSSVLREHVKPSGSSCFFFHCDLFPFLLNLGQACSLFNLQTYSLHGAGTALQGNKNTSERENSSHQSNSWSGNSDQIACKGKTQSREMQARLWPRKGLKKLCSWRCILRHREST